MKPELVGWWCINLVIEWLCVRNLAYAKYGSFLLNYFWHG